MALTAGSFRAVRIRDGSGVMRRLASALTIFTVVCTAGAVAPAAAAASGASPGSAAMGGVSAARPGPGSPAGTLSASSQLDLRRYAAAGDRAYELGTEDGRYPA